MTPKCPDCKRDQDDCVCLAPDEMQQTIERQAAQIEMMREALDLAMWRERHELTGCPEIYEKTLATTPDQALGQFAARVREQCARVCENEYPYSVFHTDQRAAINCANAIRAIKELP